MTPAPAKTTDDNALEHLGRATLQIVHDLKNQLNGLKLYATFLRKRLEREERSPEERDTLLKLIAGLDRAAKDLTALVRYSQPVELHRQPNIDLTDLISGVMRETTTRLGIETPLAGAGVIVGYWEQILEREVYELDPIISPFCVAFPCEMITKR